MLNSIILIGRLTHDPELRYTANGTAVANFSLAVDRPFTNKEGEREVDFIRVTTWRKQAEAVANNLGKGRMVAVDGRLQIDNYEDNQGQKRKAAVVMANNVQFLDFSRDEGKKQEESLMDDSAPF